MALDQWHLDFLEQLRCLDNDAKWELVHHRAIRRIGNGLYECPVEAVVRQRTGQSSGLVFSPTWATLLTLTLEQVREIIVCADHTTSRQCYNEEFRKALLEATGLSEKENI